MSISHRHLEYMHTTKQVILCLLTAHAQVMPAPVAADLEMLSDTAKPIKALRSTTRTRRSSVAPAAVSADENQPESKEETVAATSKVAVARSASTRSRVAKAKADDAVDGAAGKAPVHEAEAAAPAKKPRATRKTASVEADAAAPKPARASRKIKKAAPVPVDAEPLQEEATASRTQLPWDIKPRGPNSA